MSDGEAGVERHVVSGPVDGPQADVALVDPRFIGGGVEPDRLAGAGLEAAAEHVDRSAVHAGVGRLPRADVAVVVVDEKDVVAGAGGDGADVVDRAGRERVFEFGAVVGETDDLGRRPGLRVVRRDGPPRVAGR